DGENRVILEGVERLKEANRGVVQSNEGVESGAAAIAGAIGEAAELSRRNAALIAEVRAAADRFRL
ncbi:MAG: hypothetical protein JNG85_13395, partial [Spirochaetaceae bacterium]|nr:hypothetical protein [Spirochaetaceae bacterium]